MVNKKPVVAKPYNCLVGCQTCANLCPVGAIEFPDPQMVRDAARKYRIFTMVKGIPNERFGQHLIETARQYQYEMERQGEKSQKWQTRISTSLPCRTCSLWAVFTVYRIRGRGVELLSLFRMDEKKDVKVRGFSKGMKQALSLAMAMLSARICGKGQAPFAKRA